MMDVLAQTTTTAKIVDVYVHVARDTCTTKIAQSDRHVRQAKPGRGERMET